MHLTWKLSDDIVIVSCFDYHDRVLSEILCKNGRLIPTAKRGKEIKQR